MTSDLSATLERVRAFLDEYGADAFDYLLAVQRDSRFELRPADLRALLAALARLQEERDAARADNVAVFGALEELSRWPDLPGIPYWVLEPNSDAPKQMAIPAHQVEGILQGIRQHVATMLPFAVAAVRDHYAAESLRAEVSRLSLALQQAGKAVEHMRQCREDGDTSNLDDSVRDFLEVWDAARDGGTA